MVGMGICRHCSTERKDISSIMAVCRECLIGDEDARSTAATAHLESRGAFGMSPFPPEMGVSCGQCVNGCRIADGERGYCGVRRNNRGRIEGLPDNEAVAVSYHDPLPTNCVAEWVCPAGTGAGFPRYSHKEGAEEGYDNLAVFYGACSFDCLYCQNWHYREMASALSPRISADELASRVGPRTSCICFFGGDPTPFIEHSIITAIRARERRKDILRICWETNGSLSPSFIDRIGGIALESGGCVKVDLKAWNDHVHRALCGATNARTIDNIRRLASIGSSRREPPLLIVSTLLVPGYVDEEDVRAIAEFLASLDPSIPYSLLAFHPDYLLSDLPSTSKTQAERCLKAAKEAGLSRVKIGNEWLLR